LLDRLTPTLDVVHTLRFQPHRLIDRGRLATGDLLSSIIKRLLEGLHWNKRINDAASELRPPTPGYAG